MAAVPLAEKAPPAGAVVSLWAVKLALEPVRPALFVAVAEPVPVVEIPVNVYALAVLLQPAPAIGP